jgi:hypothetical protein
MMRILLPMMILVSINLTAQTNNFPQDGGVGIGTVNPIGKLDVRGNTFIGTSDLVIGATGSFIQIDQGAASGNTYSQIRAFNNGGNSVTDLVLQNGTGNVGIGAVNPTQKLDIVGNILLRNMSNVAGAGTSIFFSSYDSGHPGPRISSYLDNAEGINSQSRLILSSYGRGYNDELTLMNGNVGIGTITPSDRLSVNGNIRAKEVKVEVTNWPDYVFKQDYDLLKLADVKAYIDQNHHLPDVPSAQEVAKEGINLGEVNAKLLKKIEELTLYLIEKDKELKTERSRNDTQQVEIVNQQAELLAQKESLNQILLKL